MKKTLISLAALAAVSVSPAHAISEHYRAQLERSGCTQVTDGNGCDIHKTAAQNGLTSSSATAHEHINYTPFVGTWRWNGPKGENLGKIIVTRSGAKIDGHAVEEPSIHDGALYFNVQSAHYTLLKSGHGNWVSPNGDGTLDRQ